ncbi:MAG: hypothetical protein IJP21_02770 [Clostridia bacterium]|nr:hypothetical protein [Clostridia bacterium]
MKKHATIGLKFLICVISSALVAILLLTIAFSLPNWRIDNNVRDSVGTFSDEQVYPSLRPWCTSQLDNWSDSIMMLIAAHDSDYSAIVSAMRMDFNHNTGQNPCEALVNHYESGSEFTSSMMYGRDWHGYQVVLKPLLVLFTYDTIRIINTVAQLLLVAIAVFLMIKKQMKEYILPFLIGYQFILPIAIFKSLQFSSCFYGMILGIIALLFIKDTKFEKYGHFVFLFIGIFTAFFDLLSYPLITFGVPLVFMLAIKNFKTVKDSFLGILNSGVSWLFGYAGMWASKWVFGSIIMRESLFANAFSKVKVWTNTDTSDLAEAVDTADMLKHNFDSFFNTPVKDLFFAFIILCVALIVFNLIKTKPPIKQTLIGCFPFALTMLIPIAWYIVLVQHSMTHFWFTNKILLILVLAAMFMLVGILKNQNTTKQ